MTSTSALAMAALPHPERKKLKTRRLLITESLRLFLMKGYRATTLEDIATAADVTVQTLLRYFPSKEDLALALEHQGLDQLQEQLAHRRTGVSVIDAWAGFTHDLVVGLEGDPRLLEYSVFLQDEPLLAASLLELFERNAAIVAQSLAAELGVDVDSNLLPWTAATVAVQGFKRVHRRWMQDAQSVDLFDGLRTVRRMAESLLADEDLAQSELTNQVERMRRRRGSR